MADAHAYIRTMAEESLARGNRIEAGQLFASYGLKRQRTNRQEAIDAYRQAAVHLDGCTDTKSVDLERVAWRNIAYNYAGDAGHSTPTALMPAVVAWQKYAELSMRSTDPKVLVEAAFALAGAGTWLRSTGEDEKVGVLASKALKCLAGFLRHYIPSDMPYKESSPKHMKLLYQQVLASKEATTDDMEACRECSATSWNVVAMKSLVVKEKHDLAKEQAEVALWFTLQKRPVEERFANEACRVIGLANAVQEHFGKSTTKTPTPLYDSYMASKPPSFKDWLLPRR